MDKIILKAIEGMNKSYSPYSKFKVGCALLMNDGEYISGCNIENAAYGDSMCAERTTMFTAHNLGYDLKRDVVKMCIVGNTNKPISPCGSCRQVMNELLDKNLVVLLANTNGDSKEVTVGDLLPYSFDDLD